MLPDAPQPLNPQEEVARILDDHNKRLSHLERLEGAGGAWTLIEDIDLAAPAVEADFQNIPATFAHLAVLILARTDRPAMTADSLLAQFNGDGAANYAYIQSRVDSTGHTDADGTATTFLFPSDVPAVNAPAGAYGAGVAWIKDYLGISHHKVMLSDVGFVEAYSAGNIKRFDSSSFWKNTAAITRLRFFPFVGPNFVAGSRFTLYGISA